MFLNSVAAYVVNAGEIKYRDPKEFGMRKVFRVWSACQRTCGLVSPSLKLLITRDDSSREQACRHRKRPRWLTLRWPRPDFCNPKFHFN